VTAMNNPILSVSNLFVSFERKHPSDALRAVDGVSFNLFPREVWGWWENPDAARQHFAGNNGLTPINSGSVVLRERT